MTAAEKSEATLHKSESNSTPQNNLHAQGVELISSRPTSSVNHETAKTPLTLDKNSSYTVGQGVNDFMFSIAYRSLLMQGRLKESDNPWHSKTKQDLVNQEMDRIIDLNRKLDPQRFASLSRNHVVAGWHLKITGVPTGESPGKPTGTVLGKPIGEIRGKLTGESACQLTPHKVAKPNEATVAHAGECYDAGTNSWLLLEPGAGAHAFAGSNISLASNSFVEAERGAFVNAIGQGKINKHDGASILVHSSGVSINELEPPSSELAATARLIPEPRADYPDAAAPAIESSPRTSDGSPESAYTARLNPATRADYPDAAAPAIESASPRTSDDSPVSASTVGLNPAATIDNQDAAKPAIQTASTKPDQNSLPYLAIVQSTGGS